MSVLDDKLAEAVTSIRQQTAVEDLKEKSPKLQATKALLAIVEWVDLTKVCESLGWRNDSEKLPSEKHYKVAIVHTLVQVAKKYRWHLIFDTGFFYIFNDAYWEALEDPEVKQLLKNAAIKMGYIEIECRDSKFVDNFFKQAEQDGFFSEKNYAKQSIINLKNGSLVLDDKGINLKPFDYRDFLTHQLDFNFDPKAVNQLFLTYLGEVLPDPDTRKTL
jgi:putative DNA primase/helicase